MLCFLVLVGLTLGPALPPRRCPTCGGTCWSLTAPDLRWACNHCHFVED